MSVETTIALAALLLEHEHFVTLYEGLEHFTLYLGAFYCGCAYCHVAVCVQEKNFLEAYGVTLLYVAKVMNIQELAFLGLELLSFDFYDCVHR